MRLAEVQSQFWNLLARTGAASDPASLVHGSEEFSAEDRAALYQRMFLARQEDALGSEFPTVKALLGGAAFRALVEAYVPKHPSIHPSLSRRGHALADFLRERGEPGLAAVAALEWARTEVFEESPAEPATIAQLSELGTDGFPSAALKLIPAFRQLHLSHDAPGAWRQVENGECVHEVAEGEQHVVVWRQGFEVFHTTLGSEEAEAVRVASEGAPLVDVCSVFTGQDAAQTAFEKIASWFNDGWVAEVKR
jgi:hypothetical protein